MLEKGKALNIAQRKKEDNHDNTELLPPETFEEMAEEAFGLPYHIIHTLQDS